MAEASGASGESETGPAIDEADGAGSGRYSAFISMNRIGILFLSVVYFLWNREVIVAKRAGVHKAEKRRKELARQKKQEERRQRRFHKGDRPSPDAEKVEQEGTKPTNS